MDQVLFRIPFPGVADGIPIFGFATMLLTAFAVCTWLACRRGARAGIAPERIQDLVMWLFVGGIAGARIVYMVQYHRPWYEFFQIWQGGIVFYGSAAGGILAYLLAHRFILRKYNISTWKLGDVLAPSIALGLCIGRVGCFLNGCCYGQVACADCAVYAVHFPLSAPARRSPQPALLSHFVHGPSPSLAPGPAPRKGAGRRARLYSICGRMDSTRRGARRGKWGRKKNPRDAGKPRSAPGHSPAGGGAASAPCTLRRPHRWGFNRRARGKFRPPRKIPRPDRGWRCVVVVPE